MKNIPIAIAVSPITHVMLSTHSYHCDANMAVSVHPHAVSSLFLVIVISFSFPWEIYTIILSPITNVYISALSLVLFLSSSLSLSLSVTSISVSLCEIQRMEIQRWKSTITDATATTTTRRPQAIVCLTYSRTYARTHACTHAPTRFKYRLRQCRRHTHVVVAACDTARDDRAHTNCAAYSGLSYIVSYYAYAILPGFARAAGGVCHTYILYAAKYSDSIYPRCVALIDRICQRKASQLAGLKAYLDNLVCCKLSSSKPKVLLNNAMYYLIFTQLNKYMYLS